MYEEQQNITERGTERPTEKRRPDYNQLSKNAQRFRIRKDVEKAIDEITRKYLQIEGKQTGDITPQQSERLEKATQEATEIIFSILQQN